MKPFAPGTVGDILQRTSLKKENKVDRTKIKLGELENEDYVQNTSKVRGIEMELDGLADYKVSITMQFFADFRLYGLHEAIQYLAGYEGEGHVRKGTAEGIRTYAHRTLGITK